MNMRHLIFYLITVFFAIPVGVGAHEEVESGSWMMSDMGFGMGSIWPWLMLFGFTVWLIVGVLVIALLWKQIIKK